MRDGFFGTEEFFTIDIAQDADARMNRAEGD
jgi:hypothetical protein